MLAIDVQWFLWVMELNVALSNHVTLFLGVEVFQSQSFCATNMQRCSKLKEQENVLI